MSVDIPKFDPSTVDLSGLDFSDLEEKYNVKQTTSMIDRCVLCDGAPIAPESKAPVLKKVLTKLFSQCGKVEDMYLPLEEGKTKGYLIIRFSNSLEASKAVNQLNGKKLDVKHRLLVNKLGDIEEYILSGKISDNFKEPEFPEFKEIGHLSSWLLDSKNRDQFLMNYNQSVGVFWYRKGLENEPVIEPRNQWTSTYMKWSPKGKYLFSMFPQGVQSWGGPDFDRIHRHLHPGVRLIDFSPNEKFLVTLSPEPIMDPMELRDELRKDYPFKSEDIGKKLVIWDISIGLPVKTFALPPNLENATRMPWPLIKWSYDDKYCARQGPDAIAIYETENDFQLLDKKLVKIDDIEDFEFAPEGVKLASSKKTDPLDVVLSYWTPESENQSAKVSVMSIPDKSVLRTIPLVQVKDIKLTWNESAKYLCCNVTRHTKSKKTFFSNLHIFQLFEKDIPVDKIELQELILNFKWEPKSHKFITISKIDKGEISNSNVATDLNTTTFFDVEEVKVGTGKNVSSLKKWVSLTSLSNSFTDISWSPNGRFAILTSLNTQTTPIKFYDVEFDGEKPKDQNKKVSSNLKLLTTHDFAGLTELQWESSGRFLTAISSAWKTKINNGYTIYDCVGHILKEEQITGFKEFLWRPRPASLLTSNDKKRVRKNLKEYAVQFEESDTMDTNAALRELILKRKQLLAEWTEYRIETVSKLESLNIVDHSPKVEYETIETIKEVILEETEEIVEN
jgi:translation initiation factor 3 subunit B